MPAHAPPPEALHRSQDADERLLERTAASDASAFAIFVERHQAAVLRFCRAVASDPDAAEDALQETFLSAWRAAAGYRGDGSARSWLFTIARRHTRRASRRSAPLATEDTETLEALARDAGWGLVTPAEDWASRLDDHLLFEQALLRLSPGDREVLILRDLEGLSAREAAAVLDIEVRALKSRLHRARLRLAAQLQRGSGR